MTNSAFAKPHKQIQTRIGKPCKMSDFFQAGISAAMTAVVLNMLLPWDKEYLEIRRSIILGSSIIAFSLRIRFTPLDL